MSLSNSFSERTNASHLNVRIQHRVGALELHIAFELTQPWTVLFGPSGSGKTTVLRAIGGFVRPDAGRIASQTEILFDSASKLFVPAHERPIRSAGQTARLFPHKTVLWNLVYGNGWTTKPRDAMGIAEELMASFDLKEFADRMPNQLSGGEWQRAVVARAVVAAITFEGPGTALLLLDEPFSGLDNSTRDDLLVELRDYLHQWKTPVISVTHDIGEAFQLGAEIIKIADGCVVQQGPPAIVLAADRERLLEQLNASKKNPA